MTLACVGFDLGTLENEPVILDDAPDCPGARLRISRDDFDKMRSGGEVFTTARQDIPFDGLGDARVFCKQSAERIPETASKAVYYNGLCRSCSTVESDNRRMLLARAQVKGGGR